MGGVGGVILRFLPEIKGGFSTNPSFLVPNS